MANIENTATITSAALVTTPAVVLIPSATASSVVMPRSKASRMRVRMKTCRRCSSRVTWTAQPRGRSRLRAAVPERQARRARQRHQRRHDQQPVRSPPHAPLHHPPGCRRRRLRAPRSAPVRLLALPAPCARHAHARAPARRRSLQAKGPQDDRRGGRGAPRRQLHGFSGHGLRGGRCRETTANTLVLRGCRFVADPADDGRVIVRGSGTGPGALRIRPARRTRTVAVSGTIGSRRAQVSVPVDN
jgi:hypothetical protein